MSALLLMLAALVSAEESAAFLKLGVGARSIGLGGAYTALADDVSAIAWNPAGLAGLSKREIGAMHSEFPSSRHNWLGFAQPLRYGTLGIGASHLAQGSVSGRDETGRATGDYSASDTAISLSYGARVGILGLGATVKSVRSSVADQSQQVLGFDAGAAYALGRAKLGFSAQNMGHSSLPLALSGGAAYGLPFGLTASADLRYRPRSGQKELSLGTEYAVIPSLSVRGGYASSHGGLSNLRGSSDLTGFATGFGLKVLGYSLDYAVTPFAELGAAHRVSLGARF